MLSRLIAALSFFTRIPFWRLRSLPAGAYERVVELWPVAGWITGGLAALIYLGACHLFAPLTAAALALAGRLLLTGALHEDGLADFFDGFGGGGTDRERILAIMKDSRTGSYGVIALVVYFILAVTAIASFAPAAGAAVILASDTWSKACAAMTINLLPYARTAATAKNRLVYTGMSVPAILLCILAGALALPLLPLSLLASAAAPVVVTAALTAWLRRRLGGYTGDCCGAIFLLCELAMLLTAAALGRLHIYMF